MNSGHETLRMNQICPRTGLRWGERLAGSPLSLCVDQLCLHSVWYMRTLFNNVVRSVGQVFHDTQFLFSSKIVSTAKCISSLSIKCHDNMVQRVVITMICVWSNVIYTGYRYRSRRGLSRELWKRRSGSMSLAKFKKRFGRSSLYVSSARKSWSRRCKRCWAFTLNWVEHIAVEFRMWQEMPQEEMKCRNIRSQADSPKKEVEKERWNRSLPLWRQQQGA